MILFKYGAPSEYFVNKDDRAKDITQWFHNRTPSEVEYADYQQDVDHSDVLEYSAAKSLYKDKQLTAENLRQQM